MLLLQLGAQFSGLVSIWRFYLTASGSLLIVDLLCCQRVDLQGMPYEEQNVDQEGKEDISSILISRVKFRMIWKLHL